MSEILPFETPDELHTDNVDVSCSRCRYLLPSTKKTLQMLDELKRPTTDTCRVIRGLHVHPMNRWSFTCGYFEPKVVML